MNKEWLALLLNVTLLAPILGIPFILLLKRKLAKYVAFGSAIIPLIIGISLHIIYGLQDNPEVLYEKGFVFFSEYLWFTVDYINIKFMLGVDGISAYMILLTAFIFPLLILYSWGKAGKQEKLYYLMLLLMETGILGFFMSLDMLLFYIFFEMVLIPACFFIGIWGGAKRELASVKFFLYTLVGSLVMLVAIIYMGLNVADGYLTTDYFEIRDAIASGSNPAFAGNVQQWLFLAFAIGFAIKMPIFPLHTWQPLTYAASSTTGSVILAALLSKMGAYGFIRFCLPFFPQVSMDWAPYIGLLAVISVVYGAYLAVVQTHLKKLVAYASLSHLGFIVLGIFSFTAEGLSGAVMLMVGHGIAVAGLFLLIGMLSERHKTMDIRGFQGVAKLAPRYSLFLMITVLALLGLPGLCGFVGEFMILLGAFKATSMPSAFSVIAVSGIFLASVYLLILIRKLMFGSPNEVMKRKISDLNLREIVVILPLVVGMVLVGFLTSPMLTKINKGTDRILNIVESQQKVESITKVESE